MKPLFACSAAIFFALLPIAAGAANVIGGPCTQIGTTQLNDDQTGIIGCFKTSNTDNTLVWKSFVGPNPQNTTQCYTIRYHSPADMTFADPPTGAMTVASVASGNTYGSHAAVMAVFPLYGAGGTNAPYSGVRCINGYVRTACALSVGGADNDVSAVNNGCVIDDEETLGLGNLFITCCK